MRSLEPSLLVFFSVCWFIGLLSLLGLVPLAGALELALYPLYITAAVTGWLAGNVYVGRTRSLPKIIRRRILLIYFLGPPSVLYLLRAMAPMRVQAAAPLVPLFSFAVFAIFFLVPVTLRGSSKTRASFKLPRDS